MPKDTYYPQPCKCNNCGHEQKFYVWSSTVQNFSCNCVLCEGGVLLPFEPESTEFCAIIGLRTEQNLKQRRQRNHQHFRKEVLPTITDPDSKKHFSKKLGIKL